MVVKRKNTPSKQDINRLMSKLMTTPSSSIPMYSAQKILRRTMRYNASAVQSSVSITVPQIIASLGTVCYVANTTGRPVYAAMRLLRLRCWVATPTSGTFANVIVNFTNSGTGTSSLNLPKEISDQTINAAEPACVVCTPPKDSSASFWHEFSNTDGLFTIISSANAVLELDLEFVSNDNESAFTVTYTSGVATLGTIYYTNLGSAVTSFSPVGLTTNF